MVISHLLNWFYEGFYLDEPGLAEVDPNHPDDFEPPEGDPSGNIARLIECKCCFDDHDIAETESCPSNHTFCRPCIRTFAEGELLQNQIDIGCPDVSGCGAPFHLSALQRSLPPASYKRWEDLLQDREIRQAELEDLESCPFCPFKMIIDTDKVQAPLFPCLNRKGGCGKVSCRDCRRVDHRPRTCEEETRRVTNPRVAIEEAMSEALLRKCPGCGKAIIKDTGCNHIVCADPRCRTHFCYLCRKDITAEEYRHFHCNEEHNPRSSRGANGKCLLWDVARLEEQHAQEVDDARARATVQIENARRVDAAIAQPIAGPSRHPAQRAAIPLNPLAPLQQQIQPVHVRPVARVQPRVDQGPPPHPVRALINAPLVAVRHADPEPVARPQVPARVPIQERPEIRPQPRMDQPRPAQVVLGQTPAQHPRDQAAPRTVVWEPESDSDGEGTVEEYESTEEEDEEEDEVLKAVDLIRPREAVEDAYERLRNAWTNFEKCTLERSRAQRWLVIEDCQRQVVKFDRLYNSLRRAISGQRLRHLDRLKQGDIHRLNDEVGRMMDGLTRAQNRERKARTQLKKKHPMWSGKRVEMYVRETRRFEELTSDAARWYW